MLMRRALARDLPDILAIYQRAREYMAANGNPDQWGNSHPAREVIEADINARNCYVGIGMDRRPHCVFALVTGEDETYKTIDGAWLSDAPYVTIHRMASDFTQKGVFAECLSYVKIQHANIRVDTHENNASMRRAIEKSGFTRCGIIHVADGTPRIAYQLIIGVN